MLHVIWNGSSQNKFHFGLHLVTIFPRYKIRNLDNLKGESADNLWWICRRYKSIQILKISFRLFLSAIWKRNVLKSSYFVNSSQSAILSGPWGNQPNARWIPPRQWQKWYFFSPTWNLPMICQYSHPLDGVKLFLKFFEEEWGQRTVLIVKSL